MTSATLTEHAAPPAPEAGRPAARRRVSRAVVVLAAASAAILGGGYWIHLQPASESTDDAYVAADIATIAPRISGLVAKVEVKDNEAVHAGQALVRIDPEEFDARRAARDDARFESLVGAGAIAARDAESYHNAAINAEQDAAHAKAQLTAAVEAVNATHARRAVLSANVARADAEVERARAAVALARQDQAHALILAPSDGIVGHHQVEVGDYVQAGSRLFTLVTAHSNYVVANFKESQSARMRPGQKVRVRRDALPGQVIAAHVESIAPATGSQSSLIPFEPGTGNFTKIVQRVPVHIRFDGEPSDIAEIRPGLSVTAEVALSDAAAAPGK